jgi:hypothetical protein
MIAQKALYSEPKRESPKALVSPRARTGAGFYSQCMISQLWLVTLIPMSLVVHIDGWFSSLRAESRLLINKKALGRIVFQGEDDRRGYTVETHET